MADVSASVGVIGQTMDQQHEPLPTSSANSQFGTRRYCVIIPAFNAQETIGGLVHRIKQQGLSVIVVNDGSTDQTAAVASAQGALVISHLRNEGKGCALRAGFEHALRSRFEGIVTMDSDGQHDPEEIGRLIDASEQHQADVVVGDRMSEGGPMPPIRRRTNALMSWWVSLLAGQPLPDSQCGFRFIRADVLGQCALRGRRYEIETELLLRAAARHRKIVFVPIRSIYTEQHLSYIQPIREGARFIAILLRYLILRR